MGIFAAAKPVLDLGTYANGFPLLPGWLRLTPAQLATHWHCMGVSGMGKSKLLESIYLQLIRAGTAVSLLDPHSDSADAILANLIGMGFFNQPDAYKRLLYVEFSDEEWFLPFNVLNQPAVKAHTLAGNVLEAFHRAWPALGDGAAPQFDNLILAGTLVLVENLLPVTAMHRLLTDKPYRDQLLASVTDHDIVAFFRERFDRWSKNEAPQMVESTLRRIFLLTFSPILKYSLGQTDNVLDFRRIMDNGQSVIFNLGHVHDQDTRRLLGCLIIIGYESASLSRTDIDPARRVPHHLLLDEFSDYSAQSEEALARTLSLTRKFGLFSTMAHQTWSQTSKRLQGALQNVGVKIAFRIGREDAELMARTLGDVDPNTIKKEPASSSGQPVFLQLQEQWEIWVKTLANLPPRNAMVKVGNNPTVQIMTPTVPKPKITSGALEDVKAAYRRRLMKAKADINLAHQVDNMAPVASRVVPIGS